jgi:hypothetical protein
MEHNEEEIIQDKQGIISYRGHTFFVLHPNSGKTIEELIPYTAVLINASHQAFSNFTARRFRGYINPKIYLKPLYFLKPSTDSGKYINTIIDGSIFNLNQLDSIIPSLEEILIRIEQISSTSSISYEAQLIMKMLTLTYTRGRKSLEPIPYVLSAINYAYPGISANFEQTEEHRVFDVLEMAEREGFLTADFYDKTHYCNNCNHGSLNYRSVCPKCSSSNSDTQDIIHHFRCGYVGPMNDFTNSLDDSLNCPKCNKRLRHIGVDYDKPSQLHFCKKCDNKFQDFDVKAKCLNCDFDNHLEGLIEKEIKSYTLTHKGENAALFGYVATQKDIEEIIGTVKYDFFMMVTKYEVERIRQTERVSNIALIHLQNAGELFSSIGRDAQRKLIKEIVILVRNSIRSSDIISFKNASTMLISMNDIPTNVATNILSEIVVLLNKLIKDNFNNITLNFETNILPLDLHSHYKKQLDDLTSKFA